MEISFNDEFGIRIVATVICVNLCGLWSVLNQPQIAQMGADFFKA
jgi:hypothetical protein